MKKLYATAILAMTMVFLVGCEDSASVNSITPAPVHNGADGNTIAIYVVIDGSGSMANEVMDTSKTSSPKWKIANQALLTLGNQIDAYLNTNTNRTVLTGIVLFKNGNINLSDFGVLSNNVTSTYKEWINKYDGPNGNTPLGEAILMAADCIVNDKVRSKHIMAITDGESNQGRDPSTIVDGLRTRGDTVVPHFIAFDVNADVFNDVKKLGCGVVSASSGEALQAQVNRIVKEEILLEKED